MIRARVGSAVPKGERAIHAVKEPVIVEVAADHTPCGADGRRPCPDEEVVAYDYVVDGLAARLNQKWNPGADGGIVEDEHTGGVVMEFQGPLRRVVDHVSEDIDGTAHRRLRAHAV